MWLYLSAVSGKTGAQMYRIGLWHSWIFNAGILSLWQFLNPNSNRRIEFALNVLLPPPSNGLRLFGSRTFSLYY